MNYQGDTFAGIALSVLWRRKWSIILCAATAIGLGGCYLLGATPVFEAKSRLYLKRHAEVSLDPKQELKEDRNFVATQAEILASPLILRPAIDAAGVVLPKNSRQDLMTFVLESLTVSPVVNTDVVSIRYRSRDPQEADRFVAAIIDSYQQHLKSAESLTSTEVVGLLTQREEELRGQLGALEQQYVKQRSQSPFVGQSEQQMEANSTILAKLAQRLADSRMSKVELESKLLALRNADSQSGGPSLATGDGTTEQARPAEPGPYAVVTVRKVNPVDESASRLRAVSGALQDPTGPGAQDLATIEERIRLATIRKEQADRQFGPLHNESRTTAAEVEQWQQILEQRVGTTLESLSKRLEVETTTEEKLAALYEQERSRVKSLEDALLEERTLQKEIDRTEGVYGAVFARLTDSKLMDEALSRGRVSITVHDLEAVDRRAEQIWPQPPVFLVACAALGLFAGLLYVVATERLGEFRRLAGAVT